jgi:ketosteroid isomerase-like protein
MYKAAVRWMVRRNIAALNRGNYQPLLAMFASDATLRFPGDNTWARMNRPAEAGRTATVTHQGRAEIERFLQRFVAERIHMVVDDILVNGPPWNTRVAARVHHWIAGDDGVDRYNNRAVLFATARWGKLRDQEDYEDTERVAAYDRVTTTRSAAEQPRVRTRE